MTPTARPPRCAASSGAEVASSLARRPCAWPCAEPEALVALEAVMARMSRRCRQSPESDTSSGVSLSASPECRCRCGSRRELHWWCRCCSWRRWRSHWRRSRQRAAEGSGSRSGLVARRPQGLRHLLQLSLVSQGVRDAAVRVHMASVGLDVHRAAAAGVLAVFGKVGDQGRRVRCRSIPLHATAVECDELSARVGVAVRVSRIHSRRWSRRWRQAAQIGGRVADE